MRRVSPVQRLVLAAFLMDFAIGEVGLAVIQLGVRLGASARLLGVLGMAGAAAYTVGCLFSGGWSDRWGRRALTGLSCVVTSVAWAIMTLVTAPWQLIPPALLGGFGMSLFWPPLQAWLSECCLGGRRELNRVLGWFNLSWTAGLMLGPIASGYLLAAGAKLPFVVGILGLAATLAIVLTTPAPGALAVVESREGPEEAHPAAARYLAVARLGNFASFFAGGLVRTMFPKLGASIGYGPPLIGWLIGVSYLGQLALFLAGRLTTRWQYRRWPLFLAQTGAAIGMAVAWRTHAPWLFGCAFVTLGLSAGTTYLGSLFYSLHGSREDRAGLAGLHEAILGSGIVLGPLAGGALADVTDLRAPFLLAAGVFAAAMLAQWSVWRASSGDAPRRAAAVAAG